MVSWLYYPVLIGLRFVRGLIRKSRLWFALLTAAAFALRMGFIWLHPVIAGDSLFYGDLAKSWLEHGILGTSETPSIVPSLVRLPGYPAFLAGIWAVTGVEHYRAVLLVQMFFDVGTCFVVAALALRLLHSERAAKFAFLLAALCPFTATYVACPLSETLSIFFTALAFYCAVAALQSGRLRDWAACGASAGAGIMLRPDGGIVLAVIGGYLLLRMCQAAARGASVCDSRGASARTWAARGLVMAALAVAPMVPWTARNWHTFHVFQPLAPRYANAPGEFVPIGYQRWVKTWMADYVSVLEVYWAEGSDPLDFRKLPSRACDTSEQCARTAALFDAYNSQSGDHSITPMLDRQFAELARERIRSHPLRYYAWLPALRVADMWLRPRTEMLGLEDRWWRVADDPHDCSIAIALGLLNLLFAVAAVAGCARWLRRSETSARAGNAGLYAGWGLLVAFIVARSLFLGTIENPEPRYTLECYPLVIVLASALAVRGFQSGNAGRNSAAAEQSLNVHA